MHRLLCPKSCYNLKGYREWDFYEVSCLLGMFFFNVIHNFEITEH